MLNIGQAKCGVIVAYEPKAEQGNLDLPDDVEATEEQRQEMLNWAIRSSAR